MSAVSGQALREKQLDETRAEVMLPERGLSEMQARREGDVILAQGRGDGSEIEVRIDARTGAVTRQALERTGRAEGPTPRGAP